MKTKIFYQHLKFRLLFAFITMSALSLSGTSSTSAETLINGAGATFPYPLYSKWFSEYRKVDPTSQINYQSIGSGGGIRQFLEKTVDFGASDSPMTDEQLAKASVPVVHIPTVLGAVVITYNLPQLKHPLQLSSDTLADIFMGKIINWNDSKIAADNPNISLPKDPILVVHRSDGSGTTGIFTDYLSKISPEWKSKTGAGTAVNWPTGLGGKGNEGVAGLVKQTQGSIGYVELIYAKANSLSYAWLKNQAGKWIEPNSKSVTAAAAGSLKSMPKDFRVSITNADSKEAYPISGFTYLLVYRSMEPTKGKVIVRFLKWAVQDGQKFAEALSYAPLPKELTVKVIAKINGITLQ